MTKRHTLFHSFNFWSSFASQYRRHSSHMICAISVINQTQRQHFNRFIMSHFGILRRVVTRNVSTSLMDIILDSTSVHSYYSTIKLASICEELNVQDAYSTSSNVVDPGSQWRHNTSPFMWWWFWCSHFYTFIYPSSSILCYDTTWRFWR